jgi:hypothetical protein
MGFLVVEDFFVEESLIRFTIADINFDDHGHIGTLRHAGNTRRNKEKQTINTH